MTDPIQHHNDSIDTAFGTLRVTADHITSETRFPWSAPIKYVLAGCVLLLLLSIATGEWAAAVPIPAVLLGVGMQWLKAREMRRVGRILRREVTSITAGRRRAAFMLTLQRAGRTHYFNYPCASTGARDDAMSLLARLGYLDRGPE